MLLKLILENYIPLLSSGIHKVELDTQHMVNLFISKNGSGKSSILKELNPLPPENANYREGRKYSEWRDGPNLYVLDSFTGTGTGHSFKLNGKELNTGGTFTAQKDLVQAHFGLDFGITRVLNGIKVTHRLSHMSPAARKDVFMQIYPNDTNYALGVYNKLKTERNELKAAIKNQISRYTEENRKLSFIHEKGVDQLDNQIKQLEKELKEALLIRGQLEHLQVDPMLNDKVQQFKLLTDQLATNKLSGILHTEPELEELVEHTERTLAGYQEQAAVISGVIHEKRAQLEGMEDFLEDPEVFRVQSEQLRVELSELNNQIQRYTDNLQQYPVFNEGIDLTGLEVIIPSLQGYLNRITVASSEELTSAVYKGYLTQHDQLTNTLRERKLALQEMKHKLNHYDRADSVQCPECSNQFKVGITPEELNLLRQNAEKTTQYVAKLELQLSELNKRIENDNEWYTSMNQLFMFVRENGHVKALPELIKRFEIGKVVSNSLYNALQAYYERSKLLSHKDTLLKEENALNARLELLSRNNLLETANGLAQLEKNLVSANENIQKQKDKLFRLNRTLKQIRTHNQDIQRLDLLSKELIKGLGEHSKLKFRSKVDEHISSLTAEKEEYLSAIIKSRSLTAVVQSISNDIERLKKRLAAVEVLMDGLCPNKGLIGKLMTDFIKAVCGNMNHIISQVWDSPLYIKPCNKTNGDLTYKFPVMKNEDEPTPDVSDCSAGESDILDWAFRKVLMNYLKFPFPLIMDEVGPFFDEIKRGRFFNYIQEYTQQQDARQLFMVSHFMSDTSVFKAPNIVGLKFEGLTVPGEVNRHTVVN